MKKRILSLLCVLALCLGLLPTAALAADNDKPNNLYVGTTNIAITPYDDNAAYWTSDDGITWISQTDKPTADSYIHYDGNGTLTLHNVSIQGDYTDYTLGYGIYAMSSSGPVSLNIVLEEKNNVSGVYGINVSCDGGYASLNISGPGSLTVSSPNYNGIGIFMYSKTSDANLTIEGASVTASGNQSGGSGVRLITSQTGSPNLTIEVKGGNLQASGATNGIHFLSNANDATAVANLKVSGNAMVKASNISTTKDGTGSAPELKPAASGSDGTGGIIWDGKNGTVYGNVTLDESLTVVAGETLTIPEGSTLNGNSNLTNNGTVTIENGGTLNNSESINNTGTINVENGGNLDGTPTGTVVYAPTITTQPADQEVTVGQTATFIIEATGENLSYQWQYSNDNGTNWNDISGATGNSYTTDAATLEMNNYQYQCVVSNSAGSVTSGPVTLTVNSVPVTGVTLDTTELSLFTGGSATLTAKVEPADATNQDVTWSSNNNAVATVENGTVKAVGEGEATITVTTAEGSYTATCAVKVTDLAAAYTGYAQPAAQTVTITNTGNQTLNLNQPASTNSFEVGNLSKTQLAPNEKATFTVQPKADLAVGSHEESINISGSNGNNTVSTSVDATFAVVDITSSQVKTNLTVTSGISADISGTAFTTPEAVKAELTRVLVQDAAYTAGNAAFYDVKLQYSLDGGNTWFKATEATFPTEGITVTLPYPSGTGKDTHNFRVVHMFTETSARLGTEAGKTETPLVTKTDSGLQVTLNGLSPVVIGWDKIETPSSGGSTTPAATATPAPSDNITYYTCPSCGYHNWTATDAGYRCDNCGYLESTRQLSGYGNVKGTYTPGSGATSTAASTVPQTGDESNPILWTVLLLVSGLALGGLAIAKRKKQQ